MGKETRERSPAMKEQAAKPGAGTYNQNIDLKRTSPKFGFGTAKRPDIGVKTLSPGPGAYKLPARVADTPAYA